MKADLGSYSLAFVLQIVVPTFDFIATEKPTSGNRR